MQFRLRPMLCFVALFCIWFAAFAYMTYGRPVQFWANGGSWTVMGPTAYHVWVETNKQVDSVFEARNASGPSGVRLLPFGTAGVRSNHYPDNPKGSGKKFIFPVCPNHELISNHNGETWRYRFTFHEQSIGLVLFSGCVTLALPTAGAILVTFGLRFAWVRRDRLSRSGQVSS